MDTPHDPDAGRRQERLAVLERGTTPQEAMAFFDTLPAVTVEGLLGTWTGASLPTGNRLDGLLERLGWVGKRFDGPDDAHPLVFARRGGGLVTVDPSLLPVRTAIRLVPLLRTRPVAGVLRRLLPLLRTSRPQARLRSTGYRGVVTGTVCYDALPIHDVLRRIDDDTLLGAMDLRGVDPPFLFVLRRSTG